MLSPTAPSRAAKRASALLIMVALGAASSCSNGPEAPATAANLSFTEAPCSITGTLQLSIGQTARADCGNGGTTVTLAGGGASYLVVAQFAADQVPDVFTPYRLVAGNVVATSVASLGSSPGRLSLSRFGPPMGAASGASATLPAARLQARQRAFTEALRARARRLVRSGAWRSPTANRSTASAPRSLAPSPASRDVIGSIRQFRVAADSSGTTFSTASAALAYSGTNVLLYLDTQAPANGFTAAQLQAFGALFDQTLYPLDTAAFGPASDIDQNGRIIMLMSPAVNKLTPAATCQTQGYIAGFFDEEDLGGGATDPNSNNSEIFYSIVPDPNGTVSCAHGVADLGLSVPATFVHELQHLISFSQHVVLHGGQPEYGWLDEGLSIVAEELGSLHYEQQCPGTACRTDPTQLFPDSSQGFVSGFLFDSYQYALLPDTASVTLHTDADGGVSWRGGDWLLMRWLGDQMGSGFFKRLDQSTFTGVANIEATSGQAFPPLFANFGLALYTDSLPGLPRTTAPVSDRFTSRNLRQLWNRLFVTSGGALDVPLAFPVQVFPITSDTTTAIMDPGTMSYFRLDTPAGAAKISVQFSGPGGAPLPAAVKPQLSIFRLPAGQ